ncbi:diguanylate cyclase [Halomonas sp. MCCC 1A17488]|uniref:GGDEF domain-containing protein n=1 Tax=unclassified Halomonas TaxID=2609666 RepID=UPI0018D23AEF|nr:GGDEF domain-containing protein [Halomonas sp. SS10-MC5]MCE8018471.1 diguanylate cyclase [Halomonas sp. MCCC 1A17488]MCG3241804.1 diguanylate cyclase [Halomonas sp. MCCC 1A17488]QPP49171.1 diguanylate cyclase [Halomonas sp. SS10-MC5]
MSLAPGSQPGRRSLTAKQAGLTLAIALLLSILAGVIELALDARSMRQEIVSDTRYRLDLVHGTAAEAAFQLNPELAAQVIDGLFNGGRVASAAITDDFGRTMAARQRESGPVSGWVAHALFDDILHYRRTLHYQAGSDNPPQPIGELELTLALDRLARDFTDRSLLIFSLGVAKALAIAALLALVFHWFVTRPLLRVHAAIVDTDPRQPGRWPKPAMGRHGSDELGHLVDSVDQLLQAFQRGLDQRDQLHQISTMDGLTGIANRRHFDTFIEREWQRARRNGHALSVIFIDIDHFKEFNDHYGHVAGDDTLRAVAEALAGVVHRASDLVARYGGEEFVCVLPDTDLEGALRVAGRIHERIRALDIPHAHSTLAGRVTASLGVASSRPAHDDTGIEELMAQADGQLYRAKHQGRDRVAAQT